MPEDDTPSCPPAPKYTPAPHLIKSSSLTAEDIISCYKDFYENLKDNPSSPSLVFERLITNLISSSLTKPQAPANDPDCAAALEKCHDEKKALRLEIDKLKAELEAAQKELAEAEKGLQNTGKGRHVGDFRSTEGASKDITFSKPYSAPPGVIVGLRSIDTAVKDNILRATCYATDIRNDGFRIHNGEFNSDNSVDSMVESSWLVVPPNDPDFQYGTVTVTAAYADGQTGSCDTRRQITFPRLYHKPPQVVVYLGALEMVGNSHRYADLLAENITAAGFTLRTVIQAGVDIPTKCTVSWVSCPESTPNVCMGNFVLYTGHSATSPKFIPFNSGGFTTRPSILMAINLIYMPYSNRTKVMVDAGVGTDGFSWDIRSESELYSLRVCFIALG